MASIPFSDREEQIIRLLQKGDCIKDIAAELGLSINTVRDYTKRIYRKAEVHSARELSYKLSVEARFPDRVAQAEAALERMAHAAQLMKAITASMARLRSRLDESKALRESIGSYRRELMQADTHTHTHTLRSLTG